MSATFEKIKDIIVEQLDVDKEITLDTNIKNDLDIDSLDLFQVINDIEDEFNVTIDAEEGFETVGDLVNFVENNK